MLSPLRTIRFALASIALASTLGVPGGTVHAATGNTYYVQANGDDHAGGLTPQTAWKGIARVNQEPLRPGDEVLFQAGSTFQGLLYVPPGRGGTASQPVTFSSYGTGRATINGGAGGAFFAYDAAGIVINSLNFAGVGASTNIKDGIGFYNDLSGGVKLPYVRITNVDVSGFGKYGIAIGGWNGASGFADVRVTSSTLHDNRRGGLIAYGPAFNPNAPSYAVTNFYAGHVSAYSNQGDPNLTTNSGNGIVLGSVQGATIERSSAWSNGSICSALQCGAGIWTYDSTAITIQYNESYSNRSARRVDGDGFDLDQNVSNSYLQYNYSHNNGGAGLLVYSGLANSAHVNNTVRFNISENDARSNNGALTISGHVWRDAVYGNTIFLSGSIGASPVAVEIAGSPSGVTVRNNILAESGDVPLVRSPAQGSGAVLFQRNDYPEVPRVIWGLTIYGSLATWSAATGQERLGSTQVGLAASPALANPGNGGTVGNPDLLAGLAAYHLLSGSPVTSAGLNLQTFFGTDPGSHDFYGVQLSLTSPPNIGAD